MTLPINKTQPKIEAKPDYNGFVGHAMFHFAKRIKQELGSSDKHAEQLPERRLHKPACSLQRIEVKQTKQTNTGQNCSGGDWRKAEAQIPLLRLNDPYQTAGMAASVTFHSAACTMAEVT